MRMTNAEKQKAYRQRLKEKAADKKLQAEKAAKKRLNDELKALRAENSALKAENTILKAGAAAKSDVELLEAEAMQKRAFLRGIVCACRFMPKVGEIISCLQNYYIDREQCAMFANDFYDFEPEATNFVPKTLEKWIKAGVFDDTGNPNVSFRGSGRVAPVSDPRIAR